MNAPTDPEQREHELAMNVFAVSAAMVGVCLTGIGLLRVVVAQTDVQTAGDDLLAADALLFLLSASLAFGSFKTRPPAVRRRLRGAWALQFPDRVSDRPAMTIETQDDLVARHHRGDAAWSRGAWR